MSDPLFKKTTSLVDSVDYHQFIEDSLKPLGFGDANDQMFYDIKIKLFSALYQAAKTSGPSFDSEIFFSSLISDLNETFDEVNPSLLQISRQ